MAEIDRLKEIVETLRSENGCQWDRKLQIYGWQQACLSGTCRMCSALLLRRLFTSLSRDGRAVRHLIANQRFPSREDRFDPCSRRYIVSSDDTIQTDLTIR